MYTTTRTATRFRSLAWFLVLALITSVLVLTAPAPAQAATANVTSAADSGPGSFRAAVDSANANSAIKKIRFASGLDVSVASSVIYTGSQNLTIDGRNGSVNGDAAKEATWDGGLFVSKSDANITLKRLTFDDSFNNGVAVFIPSDATGTVRVNLHRVTITDSTYFGLLVDGQAYDGFNTDDVPHPNCVDPWFKDSSAGISLRITRSNISNNGLLPAEYDLSPATGCPADFDGVRVDDGGNGGIRGYIANSRINNNLADGAEFDDIGPGSVIATVVSTTFNGNGETPTDDQDDGFDLDEADAGHLRVRVVDVTATGNFDEALDFDEAGPGNAVVTVRDTNASGNVDEGLKVDEEDGGNLRLRVSESTFDNSEDDGVALTELSDGNISGRIDDSSVSNNGKFGVKVEATGKLRIIDSELESNADGPIEAEGGVVIELIDVDIE